MRRDPIDFRERFNRWKQGEQVYENGRPLPEYQDGKENKVDWKRWDNAELTSYDIPFIPEKRVKLTNAGNATGAVLSTNLLDSLADNAVRAGLPVNTAIGIATKESTLGNPTDDRTAWNLSSGIRKQFNDIYPGTSQYINQGDALNAREDLINYHKGNQVDNYPQRKSVLQEAFEFYKEHPDKYNSGQKNYQQLVDRRAKEVMQSPEVQQWLKERTIKQNEQLKRNFGKHWLRAPQFKDGKESFVPTYKNSGRYEDAIKGGALVGMSVEKPTNKRARAMYNAIDPRQGIPGPIDAILMEADVREKMLRNKEDEPDYKVGESLPERVSDAAWRKRLGYTYDTNLLPKYNGDTVRLPKQIELEIPVDTTLLKNRIATNKDILKNPYYSSNGALREALENDEQALESLRKTYKTGEKVPVNEQSYNSRQWVRDGRINLEMSPLNALQNYTLQYDKNTNRMYYYDTYDFNGYDWAIPGNPYQIKGYIDLNKKK